MMAPLLVLAVEARPAENTPDLGAPTAIEQALIENGCLEVLPPGALDSNGFRQCLKARLQSLRTHFGRDLDQLTRAERRELDATCNGLRVSGREAYLDCLDAQLTSLVARRQPAKPAELPAAAPASGQYGASSITPAAPATEPAPLPAGLLIGGALGLIVAAGGAHLARRARRAHYTCRLCGANIPAAGDLCATCRHEAAEMRRRAAAERTENVREDRRDGLDGPERERALDEQGRHAEQQSLLQAEERAADLPRQPEEAEQPEDTTLAQSIEHGDQLDAAVDSTGPTEAVFDPYAVLGVMPDASRDAIRAAYEGEKSKYDPSLVAHLGYEVQKHFKAKAQALDRAYQTLSG
jgi:DnaJ-domain-containing protein 1